MLQKPEDFRVSRKRTAGFEKTRQECRRSRLLPAFGTRVEDPAINGNLELSGFPDGPLSRGPGGLKN
jgi:hypothetical protein